MSKYIDAELLKKILKPIEWGTPDERWIPEHEIGAMLDYFPAADVVEVRHGKWEWNESIKTEDMDGWFIDEQGYVCSECGFIGVDNFNYCPNCGSRMDLDGDAE